MIDLDADPRVTAYVLGELEQDEREIFEQDLANADGGGAELIHEIEEVVRLLDEAYANEPEYRMTDEQRKAVLAARGEASEGEELSGDGEVVDRAEEDQGQCDAREEEERADLAGPSGGGPGEAEEGAEHPDRDGETDDDIPGQRGAETGYQVSGNEEEPKSTECRQDGPGHPWSGPEVEHRAEEPGQPHDHEDPGQELFGKLGCPIQAVEQGGDDRGRGSADQIGMVAGPPGRCALKFVLIR